MLRMGGGSGESRARPSSSVRGSSNGNDGGAASLPSPRERSEWRGGVGGEGRLRQVTEKRKRDTRVIRARAMRYEPTDAERVLWLHLRHLTVNGSHFRRQATIGPYFADFGCHRSRLLIEIDGGQHNEARGIDADARRTADLKARGY